MKDITCKTCGVVGQTVECKSNEGAISIESNWCANCKYISGDEPYLITCIFPPKPKQDKIINNQQKLF